jgi:3-hydroxyacyl-CoA dehydrogenase/enoyl-CoA hydratase/carnithine racemase
MAEPVTHFYNRFYDSPVGKVAIVTMDNGHDYKRPNTFSEAAMHSLSETLDLLSQETDVRGLLLTGKPYIFAAGADLTEIPFITTFQQGYQVGHTGHSVMKRIMDLPYPSVAAINGVALGGGLEIALYCKYRTVHQSVQAIGFPECFLGLIPGWGGCTLATRLLGPEKALELIIYNPLNQNRMINGRTAFDLGLADRIFDGAEFLDESLQFLVDLISGKTTVQRVAPDTGELKGLIARSKTFVDARVHGAAPAPYKALELIAGACEWGIDKGFEEENKALGDLVKSRQCKASIYSFDLVNRHAKKLGTFPEIKPKAINKVGIIGAGLMASQLAYLFLHRLEVPVVMKDISQELVEKGCSYVRNEVFKLVEKGRVNSGKGQYLASLATGTLDYGDFSECDFVIEAVFESMTVKQQVFREIEPCLRPDAVLATNTSSLSVSEMARVLKNPERVAGFHFFNPVAVMPLIEIIRTQWTTQQTLATVFDLAGKLRKTGIMVKDSPAFLVNRILTRMLVDCLAMVDEGAEFGKVDQALLALGLPMAPFELLDLVGLPVAFHVTETLNRAFGPGRFPLNSNLKAMVEAKKAAFYLRDGKTKRIDPEVEKLWVRSGSKDFHPEEIRERILSNLARETDFILNEKVVDSSRDLDLAMILGAGWPFFTGGLTMYLDLTGITPKVLQKVFFSF